MRGYRGVVCALLVMFMGLGRSYSQTNPNLEDGYKPYGTYQDSNIDSINTMNGNLILHIPMPFTYPQRGGALEPQNLLTISSKTWFVQCDQPVNGALKPCFWTRGNGPFTAVSNRGNGVGFDHSLNMALHRTFLADTGTNTNFHYSLMTPDGGSHPLFPLPGSPFDGDGDPTSYETVDGSGYRVIMDIFGGMNQTGVIIDRRGSRYSIPAWQSSCKGSVGGSLTCEQASKIGTGTDVNGNVLTYPSTAAPLGIDTMGRTSLGVTSTTATTDFTGCVSPTWPLATASILTYTTFGGATNQIKACYAAVTVQTAFAQPQPNGTAGNVLEGQNAPSVPSPFLSPQIVTVIMPDQSKWVIDYDSYGYVTHLGLPLGGTIDYTWGTFTGLPDCSGRTKRSRVVQVRTMNDGNGHTYIWNYTWGATVNGVAVNAVGDPLGNDTVRTFTSLDGLTGCNMYETKSQIYQGSQTTGQMIRQVDTTYNGGLVMIDRNGNGGFGNVFATTIKTTLLPSGKVMMVQKTPDAGLGAGEPFFDQTIKEMVFDWGQGAPGPLLKETDTTYQWQVDSRFLDANILDAPATVIVKDGSGNQVSRTDYTYDEPAYLQTYTDPLPAGTHGAAPNTVRANVTSISRWLNTRTAPVVSHVKWFDTGRMAQSIDAMGHATTFTHDSVYAGAYTTRTCNALNQCESGTYDFTSGLTTSYTNQNGATQASGNTPGDAAHTYSYGYDFLSRMTSASSPDGGLTTYTYPSLTEFDRQKKINATTTDVSANFVDGFGRPIRQQHTTPSGVARTDTTYDGLNHVVSVTNPYFSTTDPMYGTIQKQYDALNRLTSTTRQDGSVSQLDYSPGNCVIGADEAGKQRENCSDALNRLTTVLEPGDAGPGSAAGGNVTINGTLQSVTIAGTPATAASASVTISGDEKSITTQTQAARPASVTVTIGGLNGTNTTTTTFCSGVPPRQTCHTNTSTSADSGNMQFSVNAGGTVITSAQVPYGSGSSQSGLAAALAAAFPANALVNVSYTSGSTSFILTTTATGAATNSTTLATSIVSNCIPVDTDTTSTFCSQTWTITPAQNFSGGADAVNSTIYDTGTVTITVNGHPNQVPYGQNDSVTTIAANLAAQINADTAAFVNAASAAGTVSLISRTTGSAANVSLSVANSFDSAHFSAQGPSFTASAPAALSGGADPVGGTTFNDSGTVTMTVGSFTASAPYGPSPGNNTAALVATALTGTGATGLNRAGSPVTASANGAIISIAYKTVGAAGNVAVALSGSTADPTHFSGASFTSPGTTLTNGSDPAPPSLSRPYTTQYAYDTLGNLVCAVQKGSDTGAFTTCASAPAAWRPRSATFDSLSRLLTATNPETGTITFAYNDDGVMTSRTDALGVMVNYSPAANPIDALHRVRQKTYSNGDPAASYVYDQGVNGIGRLSSENLGSTSGALTYDAMGHPLSVTSCAPSNFNTGTCYVTQAQYDLAGNLTQITYPSTRVVKFQFNSGNQLDQAQFAQWAGAAVTGYNYLTVADTNFYATGVPKSITLGNGALQSLQYNKRLQPLEDTVALPGTATYADRVYNYTSATITGNNGDVLSVTDNLNAARTQTYGYDALNRLSSAVEGRWGLNFVYDPWGNRLQQNVTSGSATQVQVTVDSSNRIQGAPAGCTINNPFCYDAGGRLLNDGTHKFAFDGESRISQVDSGAGHYFYDASGNRVRKDVTGSPSTEYVYLGTNVIGEKNLTTGDWTDYVYASGSRIAQAFSYENRIKVSGSASCSSCSGQSATYTIANAAGLGSYTIKSGDRLYVRQTVTGNIKAGMEVTFTGGVTATSLAIKDQNLQPIAADGQGLNGAWHNRIIDMTPAAGRAVSSVAFKAQPSGSGSFTGMFNDISLVSADGTVFPIFSNQTAISLTVTATSSITGATSQVNRDAAAGSKSYSAHFYHEDQINTSRLITGGEGWPVWQGTFLPFGEEFAPQAGVNNHKFQDKERDAESNLDDFGARYYSSSLGRFMSADWADVPALMPYADPSDPQSLNLYSFVRNRPTVLVDIDGHEAAAQGGTTNSDSLNTACSDSVKTNCTKTNADGSKTVYVHKEDVRKEGQGGGRFKTTTTTVDQVYQFDKGSDGTFKMNEKESTQTTQTSVQFQDALPYGFANAGPPTTTQPVITSLKYDDAVNTFGKEDLDNFRDGSWLPSKQEVRHSTRDGITEGIKDTVKEWIKKIFGPPSGGGGGAAPKGGGGAPAPASPKPPPVVP